MAVLNSFLSKVVAEIINPIILLLGALAFIVFLWGVFEFVAHAGDETKRKEGKQAILWGLIGFFVMVSIWGLVNILTGTIKFGNNANVPQPTTSTVR